jgi:hypothetical protein
MTGMIPLVDSFKDAWKNRHTQGDKEKEHWHFWKNLKGKKQSMKTGKQITKTQAVGWVNRDTNKPLQTVGWAKERSDVPIMPERRNRIAAMKDHP